MKTERNFTRVGFHIKQNEYIKDSLKSTLLYEDSQNSIT